MSEQQQLFVSPEVGCEGKIGVLRQILTACKYPLLVAKADADSAGEIEDLEALSSLLRQIDAALRATA